MASAASVVLASCGLGKPEIPEIGEGLPQSAIEGRDAFDRRIKNRFPVGSSVAAMISELEQQGFEESAFEKQGFDESTFEKFNFRTLDYRNDRFPVHTLWSVRWREEDGRITNIWGVFGHTGP